MKLLTLAGLLLSLNIFAQNVQTVKIHLSDRQSRLPIEGVNVSIPKYKLSASTDAGGNVRF
ncbi:MAG: hypothetical protein LRY55_12945, partial [Leadbetterella sp.]|nr:hypothetical protein [Leadbetterella sp.]